MNSGDKVISFFILCAMIALLVTVSVAMRHCDNVNESRTQCVKLGRSPAECKEAFTP